MENLGKLPTSTGLDDSTTGFKAGSSLPDLVLLNITVLTIIIHTSYVLWVWTKGKPQYYEAPSHTNHPSHSDNGSPPPSEPKH